MSKKSDWRCRRAELKKIVEKYIHGTKPGKPDTVTGSERAAGRNNIIDPTAVGITGCSRNGKAAFTVGAFDERIALGIPQESQGDPLRRAIRAHLTKTATPDGRMEPQPAGTADLTKWVPWSAPTLTDDVSWASPPLTSK